jgi:hypothetical protein
MVKFPNEKATLVANIYKAITENITFSKRQQWAITNYTVLVYGALFALGRGFAGTPAVWERASLAALAALTAVYSVYLLWTIQSDMGRHRARLESIANEWFDADERRVMGIILYENPPSARGRDFLFALIGVVTIGGAIVIYWLLFRG